MVKMEREELSICEEKATLKVISSKHPPFEGDTSKSISTNQKIYVPLNDIQKVPKRPGNASNMAERAFETVE